MLAKLAEQLPMGPFLYEPKWDGFRAIVFVDGDEAEIRSRNDRPLSRYFPELKFPPGRSVITWILQLKARKGTVESRR